MAVRGTMWLLRGPRATGRGGGGGGRGGGGGGGSGGGAFDTLVSVLIALAAFALITVAVSAMFAPRERLENQLPSIFVSIASYRDTDCSATLTSAFSNATHPSRVFVGVCEQNTKAGGEACVPSEFEWHDQVRRISVPYKEAKGPTYARYLCSTLYRNETYFCQVDSHTRFTPGWDVRAIDMVRACPSPKAVLTHYPHDWDRTELGTRAAGVPVLCKSFFDADGMLTFNAVTLDASSVPRPVPFTSGGFVFGPGSMVREVPYDPDLPHLFTGEEILYSARLWTSGYDFFTPTDNLVFHHYYRSDAPKFWSDLDFQAEQRATRAKVQALLGGKLAGGLAGELAGELAAGYAYGMGTARSLAQYWAYAGVDWAAKTSVSESKFC